MALRLRVSLLIRTLSSLCVLGSLSLVLSIVISVFGAIVGIFLWELLFGMFAFVAAGPRVSAVTPVPSALVAATAGVVLVAVVYGWPYVADDSEHVVPPDGVASWTALLGSLLALYLLAVEGSAAAVALLTVALSTVGGVVLVVISGVCLAVFLTVAGVRLELRRLRDRLLEDSVPATDDRPAVAATTRRLAQLADVSPPGVRITDSERPESFTVGTGDDAVVVLSEGLLETLPGTELEAVLAHEVSHLANADSRIMGAALAPVLVADDLIDDDPSDLYDRLWNAVFRGLRWYGQLGVAVFSQGREWGADAGAAALTGSPAALASALRRLDDSRHAPKTDLRQWEQSIAALDILPPAERERLTGKFRTHPPTESRIERLGRLAARAERR